MIIEARHDFQYLFRSIPDALYLDAATSPFNFFEADPGFSSETSQGEMINIVGQYQTLYHRGMSVIQLGTSDLRHREPGGHRPPRLSVSEREQETVQS